MGSLKRKTMLGSTLTILSLICAQFAAVNGAGCCAKKKVGDTLYELLTKGDTASYNCLEDCIYEDKGQPGERFCFETGVLPVECLEQEVSGCKCGIKKKPRIVGGTETEVNEFPWMAALANEGGTLAMCGGTLVASKWVLSAAHCFFSDLALTIPIPQDGYDIVLGDHDNTDDEETKMTKVIKMASYILHPDFNINGDKDADIAMIKLSEEVDLNIYTPACLPKIGDDFAGKNAWVYGWGGLDAGATEYPDKLMKLEVPIVSDEKCQADMGPDGIGWGITITEGMLCAGGKGGEDSCGGDSGGPLTVDVDVQHVLVGDTSFCHKGGCAQAGYYGIYAEVAVYREWVDTTMAKDGKPTVCPA